VGRMLVNDAKQANEMINKVLNITTQNPLVAGEIISCLFQMIQMCIDANLQNKKNNLAIRLATEKPFFCQ
jgi:hypothetical protein